MSRTATQVLIFAGIAAGLIYVVVSEADGWADWVVFGVVVMTSYGFALAVAPRLYARRRRTISRQSPEPPRDPRRR